MPRRLSLATWLVTLAAILICVVLFVPWLGQLRHSATISFTTAEGLEAGKTKLRYRNVEIGTLAAVRLSADRTRVLADVRFQNAAARFAKCDTRFWVVRPRVDMSGVSGLATVTSGTYIAVDVGHSSSRCSSFVGLETPVSVTSDQNGKRFTLYADSLGSLNVGSPVYFHRVPVGQVVSYAIAKSGEAVGVDVFVNAPYYRDITPATQWWQASGIDLQLDSNGLKLTTQSVATLLAGGVVFDSPESGAHHQPAADGTTFVLASNHAEATHESADGPSAPLQMRFNESLRGLSVGAPVDFHGVEVGTVTGVNADVDLSHGRFDMVASINLYAYRLGKRYRAALGNGDGAAGRALLQRMVAQGLRGQLRMGNALTGQRYVALDVFPNAPPVSIDIRHLPVELPTVPNTLGELQDQLAGIVDKLDRVPFQEIGDNLNKTLADANVLFQQVNTELIPQADTTLAAATQSFNAANAMLQENSPAQSEIRQALEELHRTLAALHALSDYLERHPESLVWGKSGD